MGSSYISFTPLHSVSTFPFSRFLICTFVEGLRVADLVFCNQGPKQLHLHSANFPTLRAAAACLLLATAIGEDIWGIRNTVIHALDFHLKWYHCNLLIVFSCWNLFPHWFSAEWFGLSILTGVHVLGSALCSPWKYCWERHRGWSWPWQPRQGGLASTVMGCTGSFSVGGSRWGWAEGPWGKGYGPGAGMFCWGSSFWPSPLTVCNVAVQ